MTFRAFGLCSAAAAHSTMKCCSQPAIKVVVVMPSAGAVPVLAHAVLIVTIRLIRSPSRIAFMVHLVNERTTDGQGRWLAAPPTEQPPRKHPISLASR